MTSFVAILKKIPWWGYVITALLLVVAWQSLSGWAIARKVYNLALDNLRQDQTNVIQAKEENERMYEMEIARLQGEVERLQKEKAAVQVQAAQSAAEVTRLKGRIYDLQTQLQNIVVSDDPDRIIDDLRNLGFRSIRRHR